MALLGTREINNIECEVHAAVNGSWTIYRTGDAPTNERFLGNDEKSLDNAVNKARQTIKRQQVKVTVPFRMPDGRKGVANGKHARGSKILTTIGSEKPQLDPYTKVLKADTPNDVIQHLKDLGEEKKKLDSEERALLKEWQLNLGNAVEDAIREAVEAQA
jgi:hypothetical protein